ncbi:MAG: hypothetical protein KDK62_03530 [Chlamydiia bacterium]|nr:hypothetical protein [Chlamydiia bacterium]
MPIRFRDQPNFQEDAGLPIPLRPKSEEGWLEKAGKFLRGLGRAKDPSTVLGDHEVQPLTSDASVQGAAESVFGRFQDTTTQIASRALTSQAPLLADHEALQVYDHGPPYGNGTDIRQTYHSSEGEFEERAVRHDYDKEEKQFVRSGFFREQIGKLGFRRAVVDYIVAPINMRTQSLKKKDKAEPECQFMRMGAITDLRNGFTNLRELKAMQKDSALKDRKMNELYDLRKELEAKKSKTTDSVKRRSLENKIASVEFAMNQLLHLDDTVEERRTVLREVFKEMLQEQVNNRGVKDGEFLLVQLSLLNPEKSHLDSTGWMHDERNAMLDMAEIYEEFDYKEKEDNKIDFIEGVEPFKLNAVFINISVQGHTKNDGVQRDLNRKAFYRLSELGVVDEGLVRVLTGQKSNYQAAEDIGMGILKSGGSLVINCASGKDRTGAVSARLILRHMPPDLYQWQKNHIFERFSVAARIVKDNTDISVLKVDPREIFTFPGISTATKVRFLFSQIQTFIFSGKPKT